MNNDLTSQVPTQEILSTLPTTEPVSLNPLDQNLPTTPLIPPIPPKSRGKKLFFFFVFFFLLILFLTASSLYAVAYEKVDIKNPSLQKKISHIILSLPFAPKTPTYILESAALAHKTVSTHNFDISIAAKSDLGFSSSLGLSTLDMQIKGGVDHKDPNNIKTSFDVKIPQLLDVSVVKPDSVIYFKINSLPEILLSVIGIPTEGLNEATKDWVSFDTKPLDTQAREYLEESSPNESYTQKFTQEVLELWNDPDFKRLVHLTNDTFEGTQVYKLTVNASGEEIDSLYRKVQERLNSTSKPNPNLSATPTDSSEKISDYIKQLNSEAWIGKNDYLVRKVVISTTINFSNDSTYSYEPFSAILGLGESKNLQAVAIVSFSDYSKEVKVDPPSESISFEDFVARIFSTLSQNGENSFFNPGKQFSQARDTQRQSDLLAITNAIYQFAAEHNGELPNSASFPKIDCIGTSSECFNLGNSGGTEKIVPTYIADIPVDPNNGSNENTGYTIYLNEDGRLVAKAKGELQPEFVVTR